MKVILKISFISIILFTSCIKDFLDKQPTNSASNEEIFSTIQGVESALIGCYNDLQSPYYYGRNFLLINEVYADNAKLSKTNVGHFSSFYNYSVTTDNDELKNLWAIGYRIISNTNNIIYYIPKLTNITENQKNTLTGEALTLRALAYFDLVRIYAHNYSVNSSSGIPNANGNGGHLGIPLVTTPISKDIANSLTRATVAEVYQQIISDLQSADTLLENQSLIPYKCNQKTAQALLAIVYLTQKDYNKAISYADMVIQNTNYALLTYNNYYSSWSQEYSTESIFSVAMTPTDYPGTNSIGHMLSPEGYGGIIPAQDLIDLFQPSDARFSFLKKLGEDYFIKYPGRTDILGLDNIPVIRLSEMYFVIAESYAMKGKNVAGFYSMAQEALENIIHRCENTTIPVTLEGNELLNKIYDEYRKEFAFEGKRFLQLKRLGKNIERQNCNLSQCTITYPSYMFVFPIPNAEIQVNKILTQNPGY